MMYTKKLAVILHTVFKLNFTKTNENKENNTCKEIVTIKYKQA